MIDLNLFDQQASTDMNALNIRDQLASARNQAYSQVAIAPTPPMELLELHRSRHPALLVL